MGKGTVPSVPQWARYVVQDSRLYPAFYASTAASAKAFQGFWGGHIHPI